MAAFGFSKLKQVAATLISGTPGKVLLTGCRPMSAAASNVSLSSERVVDNVVYSRHEDCKLHKQTIVQRFFEQASLWPDLVAVVCSFNWLEVLCPRILNRTGTVWNNW